MSVSILNKKGKAVEVDASRCQTFGDVKKAFAAAKKMDVNRISLRMDDKAKDLDDSASFDSSSIATLFYKDLGPQIGYRTVFYLEYLGPILFVAFYALRPSFIYGANKNGQLFDTQAVWNMNKVAQWGIFCWVAHFLKREYETAFIHKFSRPTMPLRNLFKNCTYYWSFGAAIGYPLCIDSFVAPSETQVYIGLAIFLLSELGNLTIHIMLANMRPAEGSKKRDIPKGFGFDLVACPNYTFEVLSWVGFSIMTDLWFGWAFTLLGFYQMQEWAVGKHNNYKKTYDKEYTRLNRKAIIPFVY